jgi:hypothetical protein
LVFDLDGITLDGGKDGDFDGMGHTIAGELLPETVSVAGMSFSIGPKQPGQANVLTCRGQRLEIPAGEWNRLYFLATAIGDREAAFGIEGATMSLWVQDWAEPIGHWDNRLNGGVRHDNPADIVPAFAKPARVGWLGTHRHDKHGNNEAYSFTQLFLYRIDLPRRQATLPNDPRCIRAAAATTTTRRPAQPFLDRPSRLAANCAAPRVRGPAQSRCLVTQPSRGRALHARRQRAELGVPGRTRPTHADRIHDREGAGLRPRAGRDFRGRGGLHAPRATPPGDGKGPEAGPEVPLRRGNVEGAARFCRGISEPD